MLKYHFSMNYTMSPVGFVRSSRSEILDDHWDIETSEIELDPTLFSDDSLLELETFSHVEILFFFDRVDEAKIETGARHPRRNTQWPKVGIFAQRGKNRPNRIGHTIARLISVDGLKITLRGLDAIDGTPVLDIKPWMVEFGPRGETWQPSWASEIMRDYWNGHAK